MGLLDEAKAETEAGVGGTCSVAVWLDRQTPKVRTEAVEALAAPITDVASTALNRVMLRRFGPGVPSSSSLQRHRRKACRCVFAA